ncbi:MAG: HAD-IIIC family phosphatase [Planctomycetaceae bacterium]|nr:HAD-IIIC family phosphatase [Planctomycetaceae bacterium]
MPFINSVQVANVFSQPVKLVVWDLDETFWKGTLSEGTIAPIPENLELVQTLAGRGIVSSVCSKNDFETAERELKRLGIWEYFVCPVIQWSPKGPAVKELVESVNLRAENVVFVDDNPANLAEAAYHCPRLMCIDRPRVLAEALDHPNLLGKADPELTRLKQYRLLATRVSDKQASALSNVEFLRQSGITLEIRYDVEPHMDRVVELLNRANQLNFTKNRLESEDERRRLDHQMTAFGFKAGVVIVRDRYCDYGVVGFFLTLSTLKTYCCEHFVFSCRILNMGVEQYVYEYLNQPVINIRGPVANGLESFERVDWIREATHDQNLNDLKKHKLLLVGGCDMLQLSSYCSGHSVEFTNRAAGELIIRFDDPYFFLSNPEVIKASPLRRQIPAWTAEDMVEFEKHLTDADFVILSFYEMMTVTYFQGTDGLTLRFHEDTLKDLLKSERAIWFVRHFAHVEFSFEQRLEKVRLSLETIARRSKTGAKVVILSENVRQMDHNRAEADRRSRYNEFVQKVCGEVPKMHYINVNTVTNEEWILDGWHMSRQGYLELAKEIMTLTLLDST